MPKPHDSPNTFRRNEDALQNRGSDQSISNNGPGIVEVCGNKFLEIDGVTRARNSEEPNMLGTR